MDDLIWACKYVAPVPGPRQTVLIRRELLAKLIKPLPLIWIQHLHYTILAGGADVLNLSLQILVILHKIVEDHFQSLGLLGSQIQLLLQLLVREELWLIVFPIGTAMDLVVKAGAHGDCANHRAAKKDR